VELVAAAGARPAGTAAMRALAITLVGAAFADKESESALLSSLQLLLLLLQLPPAAGAATAQTALTETVSSVTVGGSAGSWEHHTTAGAVPTRGDTPTAGGALAATGDTAQVRRSEGLWCSVASAAKGAASASTTHTRPSPQATASSPACARAN